MANPQPNPDLERRRTEFRKRLTKALAATGLSHNALAERLRRSQSGVSQWFKAGTRLPDGEAMLLLPDLLGVRAGWLLAGQGAEYDAPADEDRGYVAGVRDAVEAMTAAAAIFERALTTRPAGVDAAWVAQALRTLDAERHHLPEPPTDQPAGPTDRRQLPDRRRKGSQ